MIKLFEEYNEYFSKITEDEWDEYHDSHIPVRFTHEEIQYLKKYAKSNQLNIEESRPIIKIDTISGKQPWRILGIAYIYKFPDEWFMCSIGKDNLYRCDQFEGLIKCLKAI